ncbi:MAG: CAP domain-containing protein [Alphaproteobacteria bacterium]|jgi:uncharacterized protein YkwD
MAEAITMTLVARLATLFLACSISTSIATAAPKPPQRPAASYTGLVNQLLSHPPADVKVAPKIESRILALLNKLRQKQGLKPLENRQGLERAARAQSTWMLRDDFFAHQDPRAGGVGERVAAADRDGLYRGLGENLAKFLPIIAGVADDIHNGWVDSPGHYQNMIKSDYTHVGVGCVQGRRQTLCTQVFGIYAGHLAEKVPLTLSSNDITHVAAEITGLDFGGWRLVDGRGQERATGSSNLLQVPAGLRGEFVVEILGIQRQTRRRILIYHLSGPSVFLE